MPLPDLSHSITLTGLVNRTGQSKNEAVILQMRDRSKTSEEKPVRGFRVTTELGVFPKDDAPRLSANVECLARMAL